MKIKSKKNIENTGYLFIAPFFIIFIMFGLLPILNNVYLSFFKYEMNIKTDEFVAFKYFARALGDKRFIRSLFTTMFLWLSYYALEISSALFLAALFTFVKIRGSHFFKSAFFVPNIVSTAAIAMLFFMFSGYPDGVFNKVLVNNGIIDAPIKFLSKIGYTRLIVILIYWWMWYGRTSIIAGASMTSIQNEIYESAKIDGANFFRIFTKITIPLINPTLRFLFIASVIGGMQMFDIPFLISNGSGGIKDSVLTTSIYTYIQGFCAGNFSYAAAMSTTLFFFIMILSIIVTLIMNRYEKRYNL